MAALVTMNLTSISVGHRPSPLLSVPTGVMEMITTFADDAFSEECPLSKLRLTCKQLRDQTWIELWRLLRKGIAMALLEPDKLFKVHQTPEERVEEAAKILTGKILENLLELADESGCKVQGIETHDFSDTSLYDRSWHDPLEINHRLISNLTTARFRGCISRVRSDGSIALLKLIDKAKKLSSLSLGNYIIPNLTCTDYIRGDVLLGQIRLPALEVLDLNGMLVPVEKLQEFLIEHKHTLQQVHLQNLLVSLPASSETSLSRIMAWTRDNIALNSVTLGDIRVILDNDWRALTINRPGVPWHSGVTDLEGSVAVRACLNELCDQHKSSKKLFTFILSFARSHIITTNWGCGPRVAPLGRLDWSGSIVAVTVPIALFSSYSASQFLEHLFFASSRKDCLKIFLPPDRVFILPICGAFLCTTCLFTTPLQHPQLAHLQLCSILITPTRTLIITSHPRAYFTVHHSEVIRASANTILLHRHAASTVAHPDTMSDTTRPAPNLLSMPNEILTKICTFAVDDHRERRYSDGKVWLTSARLACKHLYIPATLEFGKRFFRDPFVMMTKYSLGALIEICAHPLFGPRVSGISVDAYRLDEYGPTWMYQQLTNSVQARDIEEMDSAEHDLQEYLDAYREEFHLDDHGSAAKLIAEALRLIKQHNKPVSMALMATTHMLPIGHNRGWGNGLNYQFKKTFRTLLVAAQRSQCRINKFICQIPDDQVTDPNPDIDIAEIAKNTAAFAVLECMQLLIGSYVPEYTAGICGALRLAENLSELELHTTEYPDISPEVYHATESCQTTEAILGSLRSSSLRRVHLNSLVCKPELLKNFLLEHRRTLKELLLESVGLIGAWAEIVECIRDNLSLRMFSLRGPWYMDVSEFEAEDSDGSIQYWSGCGSWNSPDDVRVGLDQLLQSKREEDGEHYQGEL
ncbi:hypothetical protein KCU81_g4132, partial [Aureobasidium melanogenum]|uniref:Uncharacterized protein n=1 Tax=Aureobasidium melanogenum (strain CBS 110374) TaxID=1043003 RepID=A0A074VRQ4_AURM1